MYKLFGYMDYDRQSSGNLAVFRGDLSIGGSEGVGSKLGLGCRGLGFRGKGFGGSLLL